MADDFIPLNQSTPVQDRWNARNLNQSYHNVHQQSSNNRRNQKWKNNKSRGSSNFASESNSSYTRDTKVSIDAYLHPLMLQDPWANLSGNN